MYVAAAGPWVASLPSARWKVSQPFSERAGFVADGETVGRPASAKIGPAAADSPENAGPTTPISFYTTSFLLGALAIGTAFVAEDWLRRRKAGAVATDSVLDTLTRGTLRGIGIASIVLLAVEFVVIPIYAASLAMDTSAAAHQSMSALMATGGLWFILRLVLVGLGAGVLGFFLYRTATKSAARTLAITATSAFALVLVAEALGRVLFYDSMFHVGI